MILLTTTTKQEQLGAFETNDERKYGCQRAKYIANITPQAVASPVCWERSEMAPRLFPAPDRWHIEGLNLKLPQQAQHEYFFQTFEDIRHFEAYDRENYLSHISVQLAQNSLI